MKKTYNNQNKKERILISIIIPVYNVGEFLIECLDSCINQDIGLNEYEIICVDDGSTDNSGLILDNYCAKYSNIKVFHKSNEGVSSSRNIGLKNALGDYIWFVDSDDFIQDNILGYIKNLLTRNKPDLLTANAYAFGDYTTGSPQLSEEEVKNKQKLKGIRTSKNDSMIFMHLFNRSIIVNKNLCFDKELITGEDSLFFFLFDANCGTRIEVSDVIYFYRRRAGSAVSINFENRIANRLHFISIFKNYYDKEFGDIKYSQILLFEAYTTLLYGIARMPRKEMKKNMTVLVEKQLFPLHSSYFRKSYMKHYKKRKTNGLYSRMFNYMFNRIYTNCGFWFIRTDKKLQNFKELLNKKRRRL